MSRPTTSRRRRAPAPSVIECHAAKQCTPHRGGGTVSYHEASNSFQESLERIRQPAQDPLWWNLNSGLLGLMKALQDDLEDLRRRVERVDQGLQRLRGILAFGLRSVCATYWSTKSLIGSVLQMREARSARTSSLLRRAFPGPTRSSNNSSRRCRGQCLNRQVQNLRRARQ